MIDWFNLGMNAFWIIGMAMALATLSYASWLASVSGEKFWSCLGQLRFQIFLNLSGLLFCIGLAGTSEPLWQKGLWILLGIGFWVQIVTEVVKVLSVQKTRS